MDMDYRMPFLQVDAAETKADGRFSVMGLNGRPYVLVALITKGDQHIHSTIVDLPAADGKPIRLVLSEDEPYADCTFCKRFRDGR